MIYRSQVPARIHNTCLQTPYPSKPGAVEWAALADPSMSNKEIRKKFLQI